MSIIVFSGFCALFVVVLYAIIRDLTPLASPYLIWLISININIFIMYGLDWLGSGSVPTLLLNIKAIMGGFIGGWLGRLIFGVGRDVPSMRRVLLLSTLIQGFLIYYLFFSGNV